MEKSRGTRRRVVIAAHDDLLYRALDAVQSDDKICMDELVRRRRYGRPDLDGKV